MDVIAKMVERGDAATEYAEVICFVPVYFFVVEPLVYLAEIVGDGIEAESGGEADTLPEIVFQLGVDRREPGGVCFLEAGWQGIIIAVMVYSAE